MKKILVSFIILIMPLIVNTVYCGDMASEGTNTGKNYYTGTYQTLPMGKDRVQMNYDVCGVSESDNKQSIFHNSSSHVLGSLHIVNGEFEDSGFIKTTLTNGDKVFATYKASGKIGKPTITKGTYSYVGGTGKVSGIQGGGEFTRYSLQPPDEGRLASFSMTKGHWKIVETE